MFDAEIDRIVHRKFIEGIMRIFSVNRNRAEEMAVQMEKNMEEIWNNPQKFYKELDDLKTKSEPNE